MKYRKLYIDNKLRQNTEEKKRGVMGDAGFEPATSTL